MKTVLDWSVRQRLLAAFVVSLVPYMILVGLGALAMGQLWQIVQTIEEEVVEELREGADLQLALARLVMPANDYLITADLAEREEFERRRASLQEILARMETGPAQHREALAGIRTRVERMETLSREILALRDPRTDLAAPGKMKALDRIADDAGESLKDFLQHSQAAIARATARGAAAMRWATIAALGLLALSLGGSVALTLGFARWLARPIQAIVRGSRRIAGGDLSQRVETDAGGEIGEAARAFNEMAERLETTHAALARRAEELTSLNAIAAAAAGSLDLGEVLDRVLDATLVALGMDAGEVFLVDEGRREVVLTRHRGPASEAFWEMSRFALGQGLPGQVAVSGEVLTSTDLARDVRFLRKSVAAAGFTSLICLPLQAERKVVGVLSLSSRAPRTFTEQELSFLGTIGAEAGTVVGRARLVEEVQTQRARIAQILDSASDAIVSADGRGAIVSWNRAAQQIFGYREDEVLGRPVTLVMPERYREAHQRALERLTAGGEPQMLGKTVEVNGVRKDGSEFAAEVSLSRGQTREGAFYTGIVRDITERRRVEEMKSDFVSFATHQLRTPLAGIKWLLELAGHETALSEDARTYVQGARESAERLIQLVNDLLSVSRIESGRLKVAAEETRLDELTRSVLDEVAPLIRDRAHRLSVTGAAELPVVLVDPQLLRQVILNLVSNAIKYTPPGGAVAIEMERNGAEIRWAVRDSGIGIPQEAQARLFEKFYRADNAVTLSTEGTGLGLYLARLIVERFGGRLWCESVEGQGATFTFTLSLRE
ncbi:MAG: ATP-binding protein [candidate division NC10 bacterium]